MAFQQNAFQGNALQAGLGSSPASASTQSRTWFADGNLGVLALGAAIGAAVIFSGTTIQPRSPQPAPQDAQWEFAQRNWDQPAPFFSGQTVGQRARTDLTRTFIVPPQEDPTQLQPWFSTQNYTGRAKTPLNRSFDAVGQDDPTQIQPWVSKQAPVTTAAQTPTPNKQWFAWRQEDPTQLAPYFATPVVTAMFTVMPANQGTLSPDQSEEDRQPWFVGQTIGQRVTPPLEPIWTASPQIDPWQIQPWNAHRALPSQTITQPSPRPSQWGFASRYWDQPQPWVGTIPPPSVARTPTPPGPAFLARAQEDPTQLQPLFTKFPPPSQAPPPGPKPKWWVATSQESTDQIQPEIWAQQLDLMILAPGEGTVSPLQAEEDRQPKYWRAAFIQSQTGQIPQRGPWSASPQSDTTQLQPWFSTQQPPSQAHQTPPWRSFYASPQADPTQIQPMFCRLAVIPSFVAPAKPNIIKAGIWSSGNTIYAGVRNG